MAGRGLAGDEGAGSASKTIIRSHEQDQLRKIIGHAAVAGVGMELCTAESSTGFQG